MTPEQLASLHALCFDEAPRPWGADEFRDLLSASGITLLTRPKGFALIRQAGPEVELLTLAVAPDARRSGVGRALLAEMDDLARKCEARELLLEVAETNIPAQKLYENMGFISAGRRKDYYSHSTGQRVSALVMRKELDKAV